MKMCLAKKKWILKIKGMLVSKLDIDQKNSLYYEFEEGKQDTCAYVLSAWNGVIGQRVRDAGHGYLTYNFVDKLIQVSMKELI